MSNEPSQLIENLGGQVSAEQIRNDAPVGTAYIGQYRLMNEIFTHYYDDRFRLFQHGQWINVEHQQQAELERNALFSTFCELRELDQALNTLPEPAMAIGSISCRQCSNHLQHLTICRQNVTRITQQKIDADNGRYWWRFATVSSAVVNVYLLGLVIQWWSV